MADASHRISSFRPPTERGMRKHSSNMTAGTTPATLSPDFRSNSDTGDLIRIYNVLPLQHSNINRSKPYTSVTIPACEEGKKVSEPFVLPSVVNSPYSPLGSFEVKYNGEDGRRRAMDIINPANIGLDQDVAASKSADGQIDQEGNNLNDLGVFWTELAPDDPGLDVLIAKFKARAEKTLNVFINNAKVKEATGKIGSINALERFAVAYFGIKTSWNQVHEHKVSCPNCGDDIKSGIALHRNQFGDKCVLDWKRAYETGGVKKDEIPDAFYEVVFGKKVEPVVAVSPADVESKKLFNK